MKLLKRIIITNVFLLVLLFVLSLCTYAGGLSNAQRETIVNVAKNICATTNVETGNYGIKYYKKDDIYYYTNEIKDAINFKAYEGAPGTSLYLDCTGFVSMIYYQCCTVDGKPLIPNRGYLGGTEGNYSSITIGSENLECIGTIGDLVKGTQLLPGDILIMLKTPSGESVQKRHTMLYTGNALEISKIASPSDIMITHVTSGSPRTIEKEKATFGGVFSHDYGYYANYYNYKDLYVLRVKDDITVELTDTARDISANGFNWGKYVGAENATTTLGEISRQSSAITIGRDYVSKVRSKDVNGVTNFKNVYEYKGITSGVFGAKRFDLDWLINMLKNILDWMIGICTYVFKAVIIGWTSLIEFFIEEIFNGITSDNVSINVEKIVFNKVPFLDTNVFKFDIAGGKVLNDGSIIYKLRELVSNWYYFVRLLSIVLLLLVLIYIGIRMAISTIAEQKAKYKEMFVSWIVGFIIVFFIHYFMIIVMRLNEIFVALMVEAGGETSIYDNIRSSAYSVRASVGWPATIMYMVLTVILVKYLFVYIKRLLVSFILIIVAPLVGVGYALEKAKGKESGSLKNWLKEFIFTTIMQTVHALLYVVFFSIAFGVSGTSIFGAILAMFLMNFMLKAEAIFKKIFSLSSNQTKDLAETKIKAMATIKSAAFVSKTLGKGSAKVLKPVLKPIGKVANSVTDKIKPLKSAKDSIKSAVKDPDIRQFAKQATNTVAGAFSKIAAIPNAIVEPGVGLELFENGVDLSNNGLFGDNEDENEGLINEPQDAKMPSRKKTVFRKISKFMKGPLMIANIGTVFQAEKKINSLLLKGKKHNKKIINKNRITEKLNEGKRDEEQLLDALTKADATGDVTIVDLQEALHQYNEKVDEKVIVTTLINLNIRIKNPVKGSKTPIDINQRKIYSSIRKINGNKNCVAVGNQVMMYLKNEISKEKGIIPSKVSTRAIEERFSSLTEDEKLELVDMSLMKAENVKGLFTYDDIKMISTEITNNTQVEIDEAKLNKTFKNEIDQIIAAKTGKSLDKITDDDRKNEVLNMTEKEVVKMVTKAANDPKNRTNSKLEAIKSRSKPTTKPIIDSIVDSLKEIQKTEEDVSKLGYKDYKTDEVLDIMIENI